MPLGTNKAAMMYQPLFSATGGTVTTSGSYTIHTFTAGGTFTVSGQSGTVDMMVLAGAGGGGLMLGQGNLLVQVAEAVVE